MDSSNHLGEEALARYLERALPPDGAERVERHLAECGRCLDIVLTSRDVLRPGMGRGWIGGALAAAALFAVVALSAVVRIAPPRMDLEAFVREQRATLSERDPRWSETLAVWEDLAAVPAGSLDPGEHRMLAETVASRLSPPARELADHAFRRRVDATLARPPGSPRSDAIWTEVASEAELIRAARARGELHPWVLHRFVDLYETALAAAPDPRVEERLKARGLSREAYLARVRSSVGAPAAP